jgi:hypothetical protein
VLAPAVRTVPDAEPVASFVEIHDERVRVVGLTTPAAGRVLVRLQSVASTPVDCALTLGFPVRAAWTATYLGEAGAPVDVDGRTVTAGVPAFGTAALLLATGE